MPYLQPWKGNWRVRKPIPKAVQVILNRGQYLTRSLGTSNRAEADRFSIPVVAEFQEMIELAERGEWPPLNGEMFELIAYRWRSWVANHDPEHEPGFDPAFPGEAEFRASVAEYLATEYPEIKPGTKTFDTVIGFARGEAKVERARRVVPTARRTSQLVAGATGNRAEYRFPTLIDEWALQQQVVRKTRDEFESKAANLIEHLGHDNAGAVNDTDVIAWKEALLKSGMAHRTVENHLIAIKTLFNYAADNKKITENPAKKVKFRAKRREKRLGYDDAQAEAILLAARAETHPNEAHRRWVPWLAAFSGARLEEICGANVTDVYPFGGVWCLDIRLDNRGELGSLKNKGSERKVPLHPDIIEEGFLKYVASLPKNGPLFPNLTPDVYGKRGGSGSKRLCRWIRLNLKMSNRRQAPNHAWRHRFETQSRRAGIEEQYIDALAGHTGRGSEGRSYGEYEVQVLAREISKIKSPIRPAPTYEPTRIGREGQSAQQPG
jgi:integrase